MSSLWRIWVLAKSTFREAARNKLLYNLVLFALLAIASSIALANVHLGYRIRIYRDVGLSAIALFSTLIAIFVGINLVYSELEKKTIYTTLAKPVWRFEFLLGKYAGLLLVLALEVGVMTACFMSVLYAMDSQISSELFAAVGLIYVELALITALALFFSSFTTPYLAGMFTVAAWLTGHLLADLRAFGAHSEVAWFEQFCNALYWTLPNFDRLDVKALAAAGQAVPASQAALGVLYASLYAAALLVAASLLFRRRDFK